MNSLSRVIPYMNITKWRTLLNRFFILQFNYCPIIIWIGHRSVTNNKINHLHERCFRIFCNEKASTFEQQLEKDSSVSIHASNLRFFAVEMFKVVKGLAPTIINDLFSLKETNNYNLIHKAVFKILMNETLRNDFESILYLVAKIWEILPSEM